jgi:hypothetical protein
MFPLLWTKEKGFDYVTYNKLLAEADFYGLSDLKFFPAAKKYLDAIDTIHTLKIHPACLNSERGTPFKSLTYKPGNEFAPDRKRQDKVPSKGRFICPQGKDHVNMAECVEGQCIPSNWSDEEEGYVPKFKDAPSSVVTVVKEIVYRPEKCMKEHVDEIQRIMDRPDQDRRERRGY